MSDHVGIFLSTLTVDEAKAAYHRLESLLPSMDAPEVTVAADPFDVDPDNPDHVGVAMWYCPKCDAYGVEVIEVDASVRWNSIDADRRLDGRPMGCVAQADNENHTLYYLCENGNHVVTIDPTVDISWD